MIVQFKTVSIRLQKPHNYALHPVSQTFPQRCLLKQFQRWSETPRGPFSSFQLSRKTVDRFLIGCLWLLHAIDGWNALSFAPVVVVSQAPQHFRSSTETRGAPYDGGVTRQVDIVIIYRIFPVLPWQTACARISPCITGSSVKRRSPAEHF